MPVVILMVTLALFIIMHMLPGDPIYAMIGESEASIDEEAIGELREELGLNDPVLIQYVDWTSKLARGDLGRSFRDRTAVTEDGQGTAYTLGELNQYTQAGGLTCAYDLDGTLIRRTDEDGPT